MKIMKFFVDNPSIKHVYVQLGSSFTYISRDIKGWSYLMLSLDLYDYDVVDIDYGTKSAKLRKQEV